MSDILFLAEQNIKFEFFGRKLLKMMGCVLVKKKMSLMHLLAL
jgi:hypothetical protein